VRLGSVKVADASARLYTGPVRNMTSARFSLSLLGVVGVLAAVLAAASLWLVVTDPVKVATGVQAATAEGNVSPLVKALADVLYDALQGIIQYL
jgi:hypothetical protein